HGTPSDLEGPVKDWIFRNPGKAVFGRRRSEGSFPRLAGRDQISREAADGGGNRRGNSQTGNPKGLRSRARNVCCHRRRGTREAKTAGVPRNLHDALCATV